MCDLGLLTIAGMAAGAAQGVATAVGEADAANKNSKIIAQQAKLEFGAQQRELIVETDAANKEAYQAQLEGDRAKAAVIAAGEGMRGNTAGLQVGEQERQTALSIANAKDKKQAAKANYASAGVNTETAAKNRINTLSPNPYTTITNIATSTIQGYGAFK